MANLTSSSHRAASRVQIFNRFVWPILIVGHTIGLAGCSADSATLAAAFVRSAPDVVARAFMTEDQQGRAWLEAGEPGRSAQRFRDPLWKGIALEAAGELAGAAFAYSQVQTARGAFQQGNALARLEQLPAAVAAYERALALDPGFADASFNLDWVRGLIELDSNVYEDFGGTGGQLEADEIVFDERAANAVGEMTIEAARAQGLSEQELREMWMRRVQTTPGEFLRLKFSYQAQERSP